MFRFFVIIILIVSINNCSINYVLTLDEWGYSISKKPEKNIEEDDDDEIDDFIYDPNNKEDIERYWFDKVLPEIRPNYEQGIRDLEKYIRYNNIRQCIHHQMYTPYKRKKKKHKYIINKTLLENKEDNNNKLRIYLSRKEEDDE